MIRAVALILGILTAVPATAADVGPNSGPTRTRCHGTWGHGIQCDTIPPPDPEQIGADALRKRTGALVADGKCDDAKALALREGDFALAQSITNYCKANPPTPTH